MILGQTEIMVLSNNFHTKIATNNTQPSEILMSVCLLYKKRNNAVTKQSPTVVIVLFFIFFLDKHENLIGPM